MKAVILAGGLGSRISEETDLKPKPMILIGGKPILWHIMKIYSYHGINEFINENDEYAKTLGSRFVLNEKIINIIKTI